MAMTALVCFALLRLALTRHVTEFDVEGSWLRITALPIAMHGAMFLFPILGFGIAAILLGLVLTIIAQHDRYSAKSWAILQLSVTGVIVSCIVVFSEVLSVPLPELGTCCDWGKRLRSQSCMSLLVRSPLRTAFSFTKRTAVRQAHSHWQTLAGHHVRV
ncbi:tripartite tricarboxylate transporter TctB family protein [uncultured Roseibium sp.]|uniref:tripartite tricarboxylate transporter TctB family protein n=1 Tax=uncultured Roseibium sp. TaxID=1936171 RepID=UPI002614CAAF|nr:tripartite tricarboxylate transporter TctB family protein [uncultured Roseibium sp.]